MDRDELVCSYFKLGLNHKEILFCLAQRHGIVLSLRHVERVLKRLRLYRRKYTNDILEVALYLEKELAEIGQMHGYRWMHQKCLKAGLVVKQETVRNLLHILDPVGIAIRRAKRLRRRSYSSRGPNWCWHIDGYDKLSPFGIWISGCIDRFSRCVLWLEAYHTNHNPKLIAGYFMDSVQKNGGCPVLVRADRGTENRQVEVLQRLMRSNHIDALAGKHSFRYGKSISNQRIESWWCILRKECSQYWMNLFHQMKDDGEFSGDFLDKNLIRFCFMKFVQSSLNEVSRIWNMHRIRIYRNMTSPGGRPFLMYHTPEIVGRMDQLKDVSRHTIDACSSECVRKCYPCDEDVYDLCCLIMFQQGLDFPSDINEAKQLYLTLRQSILPNI